MQVQRFGTGMFSGPGGSVLGDARPSVVGRRAGPDTGPANHGADRASDYAEEDVENSIPGRLEI